MQIVITGIGSPLAKQTAKRLVAEGHKVMGFARSKQEPIAGVEIRQGDICYRKQVFDFLKGAEGVVHCAALSSPWGKLKDFLEVNVRGTEHLLDAAIHYGVQKFVHVSTPSLYYDFKERLNIDESSPFTKNFANNYVRSKYLAERAVDSATERGLSCVTVRPRAIFGPGDRVLLPRLIKALDNGGIPRFQKEGIWVDVTYIDNAAESLILALKKGEGKYNITNGEPWELFALFSELTKRMGRQMKTKNLSYGLVKLLAKGGELLSQLTGKEPLFTPYTVGVLAHSQTFNIQRAYEELGYSPSISVEEGLKRYAAWWCDLQNI